MGEPTYADRVGNRRIVEVVDGLQGSENAQSLRSYQNFATVRLPGNLLNPNVSDKEIDIIIGTGAPDSDYNSAPMGSIYNDGSSGINYVKVAAAGSEGWTSMVPRRYAGDPDGNVTITEYNAIGKKSLRRLLVSFATIQSTTKCILRMER